MKAVVYTAYGPPDVLQLQEVEKPTPKADEILVRTRAVLVSFGQVIARDFTFPPSRFWLPLPLLPLARMDFGFGKPRHPILGSELAGVVEAVDRDVTSFKPGDEVFGYSATFGAYAEYICLPEAPGDMEGALATMPTNMSYEEAAAVPTGGLEALHFLGQADIQPGEKVLIVGAGGSIGTMGVQLALHDGAEVTAVDSTAKLDMLRAIGAAHVVDYTREDFIRSVERCDVIFDVVGKSPFGRSVRSLRPGGRYLLANPRLSHMVRGLWTTASSSKKVISGLTP